MRIAVVQMCSGKDVAANLDKCNAFAAEAAAAGARWLLFPENAPFLGRDDEKPPIAEHEDGAMIAAFAQMARDHKMWVTVGSYPEKIDGDRRTYNTLVMISPDGHVTDRYRKIHLFDADVEGGISFRESDSVASGGEIVTSVVRLDGVETIVGCSICYDLRFPELYRQLVDRGAEILLVPAAFTLQTGRDHWNPLLRARAIENQCWVIAPAQFGHHFGPRWSYGHACVYDPWGNLVACASDREQLVLAEVDLRYTADVRGRIPCLQHRKFVMTEVFGKGTLVRVIEGDHEGQEGEVVWWGRSKYGNSLRAGVQTDDEKIWVDAREVVAIDDSGEQLDPQPAKVAPVQTSAPMIRAIDLPYQYARMLTGLRIERRVAAARAPNARVRLEELREVEEILGCTVPDAVVAYIAAGVGRVRHVSGLVELTQKAREALELDAMPEVAQTAVFFDADDWGYAAFVHGAYRDDDRYLSLLQETGYEIAYSDMKELVRQQLTRSVNPRTEAFEVIADYRPREEEPEDPFGDDGVEWVMHKKFGRGSVMARETSSKGDKVTVLFDDGETRKLLERFLEPGQGE